MVASTRLEVTIENRWVLLKGLVHQGAELHGPFDTEEEAQDYGDKNFPDDTKSYVLLRKEIITHGE